MNVGFAALTSEHVFGLRVIGAGLDKVGLHFLDGTAIAQGGALQLCERIGEVHTVVNLHTTDTRQEHVPEDVPGRRIVVHSAKGFGHGP